MQGLGPNITREKSAFQNVGNINKLIDAVNRMKNMNFDKRDFDVQQRGDGIYVGLKGTQYKDPYSFEIMSNVITTGGEIEYYVRVRAGFWQRYYMTVANATAGMETDPIGEEVLTQNSVLPQNFRSIKMTYKAALVYLRLNDALVPEEVTANLFEIDSSSVESITRGILDYMANPENRWKQRQLIGVVAKDEIAKKLLIFQLYTAGSISESYTLTDSEYGGFPGHKTQNESISPCMNQAAEDADHIYYQIFGFDVDSENVESIVDETDDIIIRRKNGNDRSVKYAKLNLEDLGEEIEVVTDVTLDGSSLVKTTKRVWVLKQAAGSSTNIFTAEECP